MAFIHALATICEKVLIEKDNVLSAIRVVDVFTIPTDFEKEPNAVVQMYLWVQIRLTADDADNHSLSFELVRPSGEKTSNIVMDNQPAPPSTAPYLHKSIVAQGIINVVPKELGDHTFLINFDGVVVTRAFFTLIAKPEIQSSPPN